MFKMDIEEIFVNNAKEKVEAQIRAIINLKTRGGVLLASIIAILGFLFSNEFMMNKVLIGTGHIFVLIFFLLSSIGFLMTLFTSHTIIIQYLKFFIIKISQKIKKRFTDFLLMS